MSEPSKLQRRIASEFNATIVEDEPGQDVAGGNAAARDAAADAGHDVYTAARYAIAGVGLLSSACIFGLGLMAGFYFLSAILALCGAAGAVLLLRSREEASSPVQVIPLTDENVRDHRWERNETSQLLSTIHDALGDIAIVRTLDGRIVRANNVFNATAGCADPAGMTCEALGLTFRPDGPPNRFDVTIATPSGDRTFSWHDIVARDPANGDLMLHSIARDVTDERKVAEEREEARRRAEISNEAKSRLLATVSHEIRTPLGGILGMSHLIGQTRLTAEQKNYLAGMRQSGHALVQLVDDLLDFSAMESGHFQLRPGSEPIRELLESVVEMLSHRAHEKGIEIGSFVSPEVPSLLDIDAARLRQVLFNVIGNAVKFTHIGGVSVKTVLESGSMVIMVEDTGPGMTTEEQARVFDEFEQAGSTAQQRGGSGLGLSISRRIIQEFGGSLTVNSTLGLGSRFEIRFPFTGIEAATVSALARHNVLSGSSVLLLAGEGPASWALCQTIIALGGFCHQAVSMEAAESILDRAHAGKILLTDVIVDHRKAAMFERMRGRHPAFSTLDLRRTYLVNPEERNGHLAGQVEGYDNWLIRPLREKSLVDVLQGRMKGMEVRDAINDNRPMLRELPVPAPKLAKEGILLAEDDPVNAMMLRSIIEKAGHSVRVVGDFRTFDTALHTASADERLSPRLIITDMNMPGGNGAEMIRRIRASERTVGAPPVPVIVLTAEALDDNGESLLREGADAVLAKPAEPHRLLAEIERLLS